MYINANSMTRRDVLKGAVGLGAVRIAVPRLMVVPKRRRGMGDAPVPLERTFQTGSYAFGGATINAPNMRTEGERIINNWEGMLENELLNGTALDPSQCASHLRELLQLRCAPLGACGELATVIPPLCAHYSQFRDLTLAWMNEKRQGWQASNPQQNYRSDPFWIEPAPAATPAVVPPPVLIDAGRRSAAVDPIVTTQESRRAAVVPINTGATSSDARTSSNGSTSSALSDFFNSSFEIGGTQIPTLAAVAVVGAGLWFMGSKR